VGVEMETSDEVLALLRELVYWTRFQNRGALKAALDELLPSKTDRQIYELSDGSNSQPEIAKQVGVSQPTISNKWKFWRTLGIVYEVADEPGRCRHLASMRSLGLDVEVGK